jgi:hypothetical protein
MPSAIYSAEDAKAVNRFFNHWSSSRMMTQVGLFNLHETAQPYLAIPRSVH